MLKYNQENYINKITLSNKSYIYKINFKKVKI